MKKDSSSHGKAKEFEKRELSQGKVREFDRLSENESLVLLGFHLRISVSVRMLCQKSWKIL